MVVGDVDTMADVLIRAARDVAAVAPTVALELLRQAREQLDPGDGRRLEVELASLEPRARAGDIEVARIEAENLLLRYHEPEQRQRVHAALAAVHATAGDLSTAARHYEVAEAAGEDLGPVERCLAAGQRVLLGDEASAIQHELEEVVSDSEDRHVVCAAYQGLALAVGAQCRYDDAFEFALESFRRFDPRTMPRSGFLMPDVWVGSFNAFRDRFGDAAGLFERVGYEAERRGELATLGHTSAALGMVALFSGRWEDARREFHAVLSIANETGAEAHVLTAHAGLAALAFGCDDPGTARSHLSAGHDAMQSGLHLFGVELLLWLMATDGFRARGAAATFPALWELWTHTATMRGLTQFRSIAPDVVKSAVSAERLDAAEAVVAEVERLAERSPAPSVLASARRCRALIDGRPEALISAADLVGATPWRMDYAWACQDAAEVLAALGVDDQGRELAERATRELAKMRAGGRADPDTTATQEGTDAGNSWGSVSPREREVVQLLAAGAGNPEIAQRLCISRRTVESHVANVMRKLGATNRTQIAIIAAQRGVAS